MKIFLTKHKNFKHKDSPRIKAKSFEEAEKKCPDDLIVIGELIDEGEIELKSEIILN